MGYRDRGDRSRERRDRRPPLANWSSAAEFGDATIDRPTPLRGRRDRAARQSDAPTQRSRSDSAGWATISPVEDQPDDDPWAGRRAVDGRDATSSRTRRAADEPRRPYDRDEPRRRRDRYSDAPYSDDEPGPEPDSGSWRAYGDEPGRPFGAALQRDDDTYPQAEDEPRRSGRSVEESPRRSRRALEESARRAVEELARRVRDDEPRIVDGVVREAGPLALGPAYGDDPLVRPGTVDLDPPRDSGASEPRSRRYRSDPDGRSSRTRQTTEFESWRGEKASAQTWRSESESAQTWRSETVAWRSRETIEVDADDIGSFGPRAIGSGESGGGTYAGQSDPDGLEAWRSETGTWRTRDTATTDSWRVPPGPDDTAAADGDTGEWRARTTPETGSWSRSRGRWIPNSDDTGEQPDFTVRRYDDTGEIPKDLLETARGRVLDYGKPYGSGRRTEATGRRGDDIGDRRAVDDDSFADRRYADRGDDSTDEWLGRGASGRIEDRYGDDRPADAGSSRAGTRGARRAPAPRFEDLDDGYRDDDENPGGRSRYPRYDDAAPGYRAARRGAGEPRSGRHASDGYGDEDQRSPTPTVARRASTYAGPRSITDSVITPRASAGRGELVRVGRRVTEVADDEDDDEVAYGYAGAGAASVAWFGVPIGAFLLWAMFLGSAARADCVDAAGRACPAPRDAAFATFAAHLPQVGVAVVLSVIIAMLIRLASPFWRPATVGFAASVVGGGVATVLFTVLNGTG